MKSIKWVAAALVLSVLPVAADEYGHDGVYGGVMAGYGADQLQPVFAGQSFDWAQSGLTGGIFGGYGLTVPMGGTNVYLGIETDIALTGIKGTAGASSYTATASKDWEGTLRFRAGLPFGPAMIYGTGGLAITDSKLSFSTAPTSTNRLYGWVAGGGLELQMTKVLSIRIEDRYTMWGNETATVAGASSTVQHNGENTIFVGAAVKF